jgi:hypothetical protein
MCKLARISHLQLEKTSGREGRLPTMKSHPRDSDGEESEEKIREREKRDMDKDVLPSGIPAELGASKTRVPPFRVSALAKGEWPLGKGVTAA